MTEVILTVATQEQADAAVLALSQGYAVEQWFNAVNSNARPYVVRFYVSSTDITEIEETNERCMKYEQNYNF